MDIPDLLLVLLDAIAISTLIGIPSVFLALMVLIALQVLVLLNHGVNVVAMDGEERENVHNILIVMHTRIGFHNAFLLLDACVETRLNALLRQYIIAIHNGHTSYSSTMY